MVLVERDALFPLGPAGSQTFCTLADLWLLECPAFPTLARPLSEDLTPFF